MKRNEGMVGCSPAAPSALRFSIHFSPCLHGLFRDQFSGNRLGGKVKLLVGLFRKVQACLGMDTLLFSFQADLPADEGRRESRAGADGVRTREVCWY